MGAGETDAPVSVTRWQRFGHDRLYVRRPDGTPVGYWDLHTHRAVPKDPAEGDLLRRCAKVWAETSAVAPDRGATAVTAPPHSPETTAAPGWPDPVAALENPNASPVNPDATGTPPVPAPSTDVSLAVGTSPPPAPWTDLAGQPAGARARAQARALRDAAPVRTFLARLFGRRTDERAWRLGADGEELVAAALARLVARDARWRVLHAVEVGERGADIDHVVVGPGGVFTLNTKHHPGARVWAGGDTFLINRTRYPYVRTSRFEARRASRLLSERCGFDVPVRAVLVLVGAGRLRVVDRDLDVPVVSWREIRRWLMRQTGAMDGPTANAVFEQARRSTTWR